MKYAAAVLILTIATAGCGKALNPPAMAAGAVAPGPPNPSEYVDLQPGWRLRIVAAVTKSGNYDVQAKPATQDGRTISLKTSDDLLGFETAFWSINARPGGGIAIKLASAQLTVDGKPSPILKPVRALVNVPPFARFVRVFYLTRKSDADHNMAMAGAAKLDQLEAFTAAFRESPNEACADHAKPRLYCQWIPAGLAVRPETPRIVDGVTEWPKQ